MRGRQSGSGNGYDVAQICHNGHVVNASTKRFPKHNRDYCEDCGAESITSCPDCGSPIPGTYHVEGHIGSSDYETPSFCGDCGEPYPWMAESLEAARALSRDMEGLDKEERAKLEASLDDIVRETPRTQLAAKRVKDLMSKAKGPGATALTNMLSNIASKAAMGLLF